MVGQRAAALNTRINIHTSERFKGQGRGRLEKAHIIEGLRTRVV